MPSRSATSCLIGVALIFIVVSLGTRPAYAGSYDVYACDGAVGGGANNAFYAVADAGMTVVSHPGQRRVVMRLDFS